MLTVENIVENYVIGPTDDNALAYNGFSKQFGLFPAERSIFDYHVELSASILDLGCGTGRVSFSLHDAGYKNVTGCDISPHMITQAREHGRQNGILLPFMIGDATDLNIWDNAFDIVIFSYNGIMTIPGIQSRLKAFKEVHRILKPGGQFIFSTYQRDLNKDYAEFWIKEEEKWQRGEQDPRLFEFGDIIKSTQLESNPVFVHFPDAAELHTYRTQSGFSKFEECNVPDNQDALAAYIQKLQYFILTK